MNDNNNNDNNDNRSDGGEYWWVLPLLEDTQRHGYISAESKQAAANSTEVRLLMLAWKIAVVGCVVAMAAWFALAIVAPSWRHVPLAIAALFASVGVVFPFYAIWRMTR